MDVPPETGLVVGPFLAVAAWLKDGGFSAPEVLGADPARGLVLLEDLGDDLFARLCGEAPERAGHAQVGMLDFQDMLVGHAAYDLMSLLEDARRDVTAEVRSAMLARYLERSGAEAEAFGRAAHVLAAQRNLKIMGLFTRLCRRDRKPRYLGYLPRVWRHLQQDLAHPELAALRGFILRHVPAPEPVALALARIEAGA